MTTIKIQRNIYLDYLRGLSALAVMLFHYTTRYDMLFGHTGGYPLYFKYGSYGVLVFFLLSGYLTFGRIDNVRKSPRKFLYKRFEVVSYFLDCNDMYSHTNLLLFT